MPRHPIAAPARPRAVAPARRLPLGPALIAGALGLLLLACTPPDLPPPPGGDTAAPFPTIAALGPLLAEVRAVPDFDGATLVARAEALRRRAAILRSIEVLDDATRARLKEARDRYDF